MATARNASRAVGVYIDIIQPGYHNAIALANGATLQEDLVLNAVNATTGTPTSACLSHVLVLVVIGRVLLSCQQQTRAC